jgi:hypothetical protein
MSRRDSGYQRKERDDYTTPEWNAGSIPPTNKKVSPEPILEGHSFRTSSGSLAMFAAIRRASLTQQRGFS